MRKCVSYCMTRNIYPMVIPSMKSLLTNNDIDTVYLITEDDDIGIELPDICKVINVSDQQYILRSSPNYNTHFTWMVMIRLALPFILKDEERVLSLDLDTIIQSNIEDLWDMDMSGKYVAGVPNYSLGAQELHTMNTDWIMPIGYSVIGIIYATAAVLVIYSSTVIYIKLQTGDDGFLKSVTMLLGAILFLFSAIWVIPGFLGSGGSTPLW